MPKQFVHIVVDIIDFFEKNRRKIISVVIHAIMFFFLVLAIIGFLVTLF